MTTGYKRVIPRDLFNEGNLLKCYGKLYLHLETLNLPDVSLEHENDEGPFEVWQNQGDGSLSLVNVKLIVRGLEVPLERPINSREPWPLIAIDDEGNNIQVFEDDGTMTHEMWHFLEGVKP